MVVGDDPIGSDHDYRRGRIIVDCYLVAARPLGVPRGCIKSALHNK